MLDKELMKYIETAIMHNLIYDHDKYCILAIDDIYFELNDNKFTGFYNLVEIELFTKIAKKLKKENIIFNKENSKEIPRIEKDFSIDCSIIMNTLYNMTGL